jgi:hypothetical protein
MGLMGVAIGTLVRAGVLRAWARNYFTPGLPAQLHNGQFALIPLGAAFLLTALGASIAQSAEPPDQAWPFFGFGVLSLIIGIWWVIRPPEWMKPAWLQAEEQAIREGLPVPDRRQQPYSPRAYALNWLGLIVGSVVWLKLGLPVGALLIGLGTGISLLVAKRPTRT